VGAEPAGHADPALEPPQHVLEAAGADLAAPPEEQRIVGMPRATLAEVADRPASRQYRRLT
jgi:hypothetical protein